MPIPGSLADVADIAWSKSHKWEATADAVQRAVIARLHREGRLTEPVIDPRSTLPWRVGTSGAFACIVSDKPTAPNPELTGHGDVEHYGGYLIAESIPPKFAAFIVEVMNQQPPF